MRQRQLDRSWQYDLAPARANVLAVMFLAGAAMCVISGWINTFPGAPIGLYRGVAVAGALFALLLAGRGDTLPRWAIQALLALFSLMIGVLGYAAARDVAVISLGPAVIAVSTYAGYFSVSRSLYLQVTWSTGVFAVSALLAPIRPPVVSVLTVIVTAWALALLLNRLTTELRRRSTTDALTGVASRTAWVDIAERTIGATRGPVTVAIIDMDNFKRINDSAGHLAGDLLLQEVTAAWQRLLPASALIGRFGGDEFVVLFTDAAAAEWIGRMTRIHPAPWSTGLAQHLPGESLTELLHRADLDLLDRKRARQSD